MPVRLTAILDARRGISRSSPTSIHAGFHQNRRMETQDSIPTGSPSTSPNDEAPALVAALKQSQVDIECEKSELARTLHDDLGGLLVGAVMDMDWIGGQPGLADMVRMKLARAQGLLGAAISMERELIENLRPTLLDNVGLYSTLRWHMKACCGAAAVPYEESFPREEQAMSTEIRIGVFRIIQEALKSVLGQSALAGLSLTVEEIDDTLHCHLTHRSSMQDNLGGSVRPPETSMHQRAVRVGGTLHWSKSRTGHEDMHLQVPIVA